MEPVANPYASHYSSGKAAYPTRHDMKARLLSLNVLALLLASNLFFPIAFAASWPERPVRIIIPWPPGGSTDIVGRILAADLSARLKQQMVIDNRAGAGSIVGLQIAAASPPGGLTFKMTFPAFRFLIDKPEVALELV